MRHLLLPLGLTLLAAPALGQRSEPAPVPPVDTRVAALRDAALKDEVAYDIVAGITTDVGPRLAATEAEARARTWAVAKLKALGFRNVHVESYRMPVWLRGEETAEVVAPFPQKLRLTALGTSVATPAGGLTLPIVYFPSFAELQAAPVGSLAGKIAFVSNAMQPTMDGSGYGTNGVARFVGPGVAAQKGAAAIVIRSVGTDHGRGPHAGSTTFAAGVTPIPAAALSVADAENLERMVRSGKPVVLHLTLTPRSPGDGESGNVVAEVPGSDARAGVVLVGGHLDSWDLGTGAIDDGAGIAITTAAAKRLLDGPRPRRTIRVVWFGAEEPGGYGGRAYAEAHKADHHVFAAESDLGSDRAWRVQASVADANKPLFDRVAAAVAPLGIVKGTGPAEGGTDVGPTLRTGVASIGLDQSALRYFDYHHTPEDTLDRVDPEQLRQNVAAWTALLAVVANAPEEIAPAPPRPAR